MILGSSGGPGGISAESFLGFLKHQVHMLSLSVHCAQVQASKTSIYKNIYRDMHKIYTRYRNGLPLARESSARIARTFIPLDNGF